MVMVLNPIHSTDLDFGVVVVRHVPAVVSEQCGSEWIDDRTVGSDCKLCKEKNMPMVEVSSFHYGRKWLILILKLLHTGYDKRFSQPSGPCK